MARAKTKQVRNVSVLLSALVMVVSLLFSSAVARAEAPTYPLSYSGRLTLPGGEPMQGPVDLQVKFWDAVSGGNPLASAFPFTAVTLNQGVFQIQIPTGSDDIAAIFGDGTKTVFIEVTAKGITYPRQDFSYVPLALRVPVDMKTVAFDGEGKLKVVIPARPSADKILSVDSTGKFAWESLAVNTLQNKPVSQQVPSSGQVLTYDGSQWVPQTVNQGGSVTGTSITAGAGLTGGTITTSGTISLAPTGVTAGTYPHAQVVVDSTGRITSATSGAPIDLASDVTGVLPVAKGGTGTDLSSTGGARQYLKQATAGGLVSVGTIPAEDITQALGYTPLNKAGDTLTGTLTLGTYVTDPVGLQAADKGKTWFNSNTNQIKYWDGSSAVALGVAGSGLTSLNGQSGNTQIFAMPGTSGTAPDWSSSGNVHTLNIPMASAASVTAGLLSNAEYTSFKNKVSEVAQGTGIAVTTGSGTATVSLTNTSVAAGSYTRANITVDAQGRLTGAVNAAAIVDSDIAANAAIAQSKVAGLSSSLASKENTITAGTSSQYYRGDKSWQELNTSSVAESGTSLYYNDARSRSALSATGPVTYSVMSGAIGITQSGSTANGYLSSTDWAAFNTKQNALGYTPLNKAGDTLTGALDAGGFNISNTGNIQMAAAKTLGFGVYATDPTGLSTGDRGKTWYNSTSSQVKYWDGSTAVALGAAGSENWATPGAIGATTPNSGAFTNITSNAQSGYEAKPYGASAGNTGEMRFTELSSGGSNYVGFKAPDAIGANKVWVLPAADGTVGQLLKTDGTGNLGWVSPTTGTVTSVGITAPAAGVTVSGGPITASGIMTLALANDLAAVEGLSTTGGVERTASDTWSTYTLTAAGKALLDDADATAQRTTLGLGALATVGAVSGGVAGTISDGTITDADISSSANIADTKLATITTAGKVSGAAIASGTIGGSTGINTSGNLLTSGIVGIGTTAPGSQLHVSATLPNSGPEIKIENLSATTASAGFRLKNTNRNWGMFVRGDASNVLAFQDDTASAIRMAIDGNGNVGIGTTAPLAALDVNGAVRLSKNSSQPYACTSDTDGSLALTNGFGLCLCVGNVSRWLRSDNLSQSCIWTTGSKTTFSYKSAEDTFVVPIGVTQLTFKAWGGGGGGSNYASGGGAGFAKSTLTVSAGDVLKIKVAGGGQISSTNGSRASGGYNGGGVSGVVLNSQVGGGGGATTVYLNGTLVLVAAGGGGGSNGFAGGVGGGASGAAGFPYGGIAGLAGGGGTSGGGGAAGSPDGSAGSSLQGGTGGPEQSSGHGAGGGGGGGYFGGGGASGGLSGSRTGSGGGGGSSYAIASGANTTLTSGSSSNAGNNIDSDYQAGIGAGSTASGSNGLLIISLP